MIADFEDLVTAHRERHGGHEERALAPGGEGSSRRTALLPQVEQLRRLDLHQEEG